MVSRDGLLSDSRIKNSLEGIKGSPLGFPNFNFSKDDAGGKNIIFDILL